MHTYSLVTVDDSNILHTIVERYLDGTEFVPAGRALDGDEAMERVRDLRPDVVLLDIVMPGVSGVDTLTRMLSMNPGARVVMASSIGTEESVRDCLRAGAKTFLIKPFTRDDLIACLRRVVEPA